MCTVTKKEGGVRPIAVGCTYRRLASKLAAKYGNALVSKSLRPLQLRVGTPGGCEALVHAARNFSRFTTANRNQPTVLVKVALIKIGRSSRNKEEMSTKLSNDVASLQL